MPDADFLLFKKEFNGKPLFKNQLDLVTQLLTTRQYSVDSNDPEAFSRAQTRLKTYISQILSASGNRNITEDLRISLEQILSEKLNDPLAATITVDDIVKDLKEKSASVNKQIIKGSLVEQLNNDINNANYIALFTARPLEIASPTILSKFSFRFFLLMDLLDCLINKEKEIKFYRFNFPLDSSAVLFWKGLKKILFNYLLANIQKDFIIDILYEKFTLKTLTVQQLKQKETILPENVINVVNEMLELLNRNKKIMVFVLNTPVYAIPILALDPAEAKNAKVYAILNNEKNDEPIFKYQYDDAMLWRLFVWDQLKTERFGGRNIPFTYFASGGV